MVFEPGVLVRACGDAGADAAQGGAGDNTVNGDHDGDVVCGGSGEDRVSGGPAMTPATATRGRDVLTTAR